MSLLSPLDDFVQRTLAFVPGTWGKLYYIAGLRDQAGDYQHWGMARTHGQQAASHAIAEAHRTVLLRILRTGVDDLLSDAVLSASALDQPLPDFLRVLAANVPALLPSHMGGGSARHFSSVLQALGCLARVGTAPNRPAS